jgi:hypothetical protein
VTLASNFLATSWAFTQDIGSSTITDPVQIAATTLVELSKLLTTAPIGVDFVEGVGDQQIFHLVESRQGTELTLLRKHQMAWVWDIVCIVFSLSSDFFLDAQVCKLGEKLIIFIKWVLQFLAVEVRNLENRVLGEHETDHGVDNGASALKIFDPWR